MADWAKAKRYDVIQGRNEAEKRSRPFGDRSVESDFFFVCNKSLTTGWGKSVFGTWYLVVGKTPDPVIGKKRQERTADRHGEGASYGVNL